MRKELYGMTREDASDENSYILEYYLIENNSVVDGDTMIGYGVEVKKLIPLTGGTTDKINAEETSMIKNIFVSRSRAEQFVRLLTDCKVTPAHLMDITLDFINDDVSAAPASNERRSA